MARYPILSLKFMKIRENNDNYYYLGISDYNVRRVFIPTLDKSYSFDEISFDEDLTYQYVMKTRAHRAVNEEWDGDEFYYSQRHLLNESMIRKIEKYRNPPQKPYKTDPKFFR